MREVGKDEFLDLLKTHNVEVAVVDNSRIGKPDEINYFIRGGARSPFKSFEENNIIIGKIIINDIPQETWTYQIK